ncbi:peroxisomal biogenesis factor 11 [Schizosaccharomyces cryophilus OY26]|uniref:Peroxisomal biogenesis factor 11 n=1 Tax=Schizosaccharomyces cryophilus (strain OY26 / ATCC MYA-4695 / CBS 11777 / NBRC 106824 / NRRL Y48691) TaxID=653667 RepID=S9X1W3_SCHCR|nr:peroxisomal biogenesis factor 11 [Schizosaccharomyces cryophilus OY26]EPY51092.1 peroxisomal biogenesis factor 11 [Schizosaccharomyces cryophilus OY26]
MAVIFETAQYAHVLRMLNSMSARDKSFRTLQFVAKLLAWRLYYNGSSLESVNKWDTLESQISFARKLFSIGKVFDYLSKSYFGSLQIQNPLSSSEAALPSIQLTRDIAFTGYSAMELVGWLQKARLIDCPKSKRVSTLSKQFLAAALLSSCFAGVYNYQKISEQLKSIQASESGKTKNEASIESLIREKNEIVYFAIQNALDAVIPLAELDVLKLDDGFVAMTGITTSIMGLYKTWSSN